MAWFCRGCQRAEWLVVRTQIHAWIVLCRGFPPAWSTGVGLSWPEILLRDWRKKGRPHRFYRVLVAGIRRAQWGAWGDVQHKRNQPGFLGFDDFRRFICVGLL